jgi:excisionase family DNA binding protein
MMNPERDCLLDINQAADYLRLSPGTLYHWVSERRINVVKMSGRCIRFRKSDLDKWIASKLVTQRPTD